MKIFIVLGIMFMLVTMNAQASVIVLKDGRTITGDIIQQDKTKVIVENNGVSLTYYKDEIVSIKEESSSVRNNDADPEAEKVKLVEQYLGLFPTSAIVSSWVGIKFYKSADERKIVLSALNDDQNTSALTDLRGQGFMKYFTLADLKAAINFYTSPEGKHFLEDLNQYHIHTDKNFYPTMGREAAQALKNGKQNTGSLSGKPQPSGH